MHLPTGPLGRLQSVTVLKKRNSRRRRPRLTSRCMCRVGRKLWTSWRLSAVLSRTQLPPGAIDSDRSFLAPVLRQTRRAVGGKCRLARFCSHR